MLLTNLKKYLPGLWLILPALVIYSYFAYQLDFIQDDAYITYRYVENFLDGHGLVYNIGERVEGYTNFGWLIYLIFWGALGANYILASQITGYILGLGIIIMTYLLARLIFKEEKKWYVLLPVYLIAFNRSLAYWSPAGLETAAFAFMAAVAIYCFLQQNYFLIAALTLAVWLRPEGALLAILFIVIEAIVNRRFPKFAFTSSVIAFIFSLPFVIFKIIYYNSLLPNPFYAKTGFDFEQLTSGLEYFERFMSHYGFYGAALLIPLIFIKKLPRKALMLWLLMVLYSLYIILVGGDVLKVHRFFIPVFGVSAILIAISINQLIDKLNIKTQYLIALVVAVPLIALTFYQPKDFIRHYNLSEIGFIKKMTALAEDMKNSDSTNFSVALPTIGVFGYDLLGHDIIDMVGLTDTTIARYSEAPIEGMETTWKERKHNTRYILEKAPTYIVFSTGIKPSAPAERALLLYPAFLNSYRLIGWFYPSGRGDGTGKISTAFKKMRPIEGALEPTYPIQYVQYYKKGLDYYVKEDHRRAIAYYDSAIAVSPKPYNIYLIYHKAVSHLRLNQHKIAMTLMNNILERDSLVFGAHKDLYLYETVLGNKEKAKIHERWIKKLAPWYWPRVDSIAQQVLRDMQRRQRSSQ